MMRECVLWISVTSMLVAGGAEVRTPAQNVVLLTLPKLDWALEVGGMDFVLEKKEVAPEGKSASFLGKDRKSGILISAFLEERDKPGTAEECRAFYWAKAKDSPLKKDDIVQSKLGNLALVEFLVREHEGVTTNQKHVNAYLTKGNFWIDVHLSKMYFEEGERELFNSILRNVKLMPKGSSQKVRVNYRITQQAILGLDLPPGWRDQMQPRSGLARMILLFTPAPEGSASMFISVLCPKEELSDAEARQRIRVLLEDSGRKLLPQSIESFAELHELKGRSSTGYYFTLTDKAPKPGEYKYMMQGGYAAGKLILMFMLTFNDKNSEMPKLVREMVGSAQAMPDK